MYNLIEYSNNYLKTSGSLWQYYRDKPALANAGVITTFSAVDNSALLNFKNIYSRCSSYWSYKQNVEITVSLKYLSNFRKTLEMLLINFEINFIWTWPEKWVS